MNATWNVPVLFGQVDFFCEAYRKHAEESSRMYVSGLLILLFAAIGLAVLLFVLSKVFSSGEKKGNINSPVRLYWALCRAHRLSMLDRWLLWRVARHWRLSNPALVFVEPELLDADSLGPSFAGRAAGIKSLHERLFDGLFGNGK